MHFGYTQCKHFDWFDYSHHKHAQCGQKGFAPLVVIISIVAIFTISAGGYYLYNQNQIKNINSFEEANKNLQPSNTPKPEVCIQIIAPAKDPKTGECKEFPTPCDVPEGWEKVDKCIQEPASGKELLFETTDKGSDVSSFTDKRQLVINNESEWKDLWNKTHYPSSSIPMIDFKKHTIIAVFQGGMGQGGYTIEVVKVVEQDNTIDIFIKERGPDATKCPGPPKVTYLYHIIKLPKITKTVVFQTEKVIIGC